MKTGRGSSVGSNAPGMQVVPRLSHSSSTFIRGDLVIKIFLQPFLLFHGFKESSCQLMGKETERYSSGKLPLGGLPWNSVVRIIDRPDMTIAVYRGHKAINQTNKN